MRSSSSPHLPAFPGLLQGKACLPLASLTREILPLSFRAYLLCHFSEALSDAGRLSWDARDPRHPLLHLAYPALMPEFSSSKSPEELVLGLALLFSSPTA